MRGLILSLCFVPLLYAAPVPKYRAKPLPEITPGIYEINWSNFKQVECSLFHKGGWLADWNKSGQTWWGSWTWNGKTRTLSIRETVDGVDWHETTVVLDKDLKGKGDWNKSPNKVDVQLIRKRNIDLRIELIQAMPLKN